MSSKNLKLNQLKFNKDGEKYNHNFKNKVYKTYERVLVKKTIMEILKEYFNLTPNSIMEKISLKANII